MQVINNNELFTEVSAKESVTASGGNAQAASFALAGFLTDNTLTAAEALSVIAIAIV